MNRSTLLSFLTFFFISSSVLSAENNKDQIAITIDGTTFIIPTKWEVKEINHTVSNAPEKKQSRLKKFLSSPTVRKTIGWGSALITVSLLLYISEIMMKGLAAHLDRPPHDKNKPSFDLKEYFRLYPEETLKNTQS